MQLSRYALPSRFVLPLAAANVLLAIALFAVHLGSRVEPTPALSGNRLASLPIDVGGWHGEDGEWTAETVTAIGAEDWLLRRYQDAAGDSVWLYVGFHNSVSFGGASPHSPRLCYPGQGWTVLDATIERIPLPDGASIDVNRLLVQKDLEQRVVLYWLQWGAEVTTERGEGDYLAKLAWMLRLPFLVQHEGRTDRSLVRVSARVDRSPDRALATSANFVGAVFPLLSQHFDLVTNRSAGAGP